MKLTLFTMGGALLLGMLNARFRRDVEPNTAVKELLVAMGAMFTVSHLYGGFT